jgi:putative glutamine amidotransferase
MALLAGPVACATRSASTSDLVPSTANPLPSDRDGPVLLVTNPTESTVRDVLSLVEASLLSAQNLRVVGIHHSSDPIDTEPAQRLLQQHRAEWFSIEKVSCELADDPFAFSPSCFDSFEKLFQRSDGIIFGGGPDLPALDYGQTQSLLTTPGSLERTRFELALASALLGGKGWKEHRPALMDRRTDYLVFGICLGMQELNVALGGSLYQDIPLEIYGLYTYEEVRVEPRAAHRRYRVGRESSSLGRYTRHRLREEPEWTQRGLPGLEEDSPRVFSAHHQAVKLLGQELEILATSRDRAIVEALGHKRYPNVLGVQFHPEHAAVAAALLSRKGPAVDAPSLSMHQKLWSWVSKALQASANHRMPHASGNPTPAR